MLLDTARLGWRNLGRNLRRTLSTGAALAFGICLCVASYGLIDGLSAQMLEALTRLDLGHVQIHAPKFAKRRSLQETVDDADQVVELATTVPGVVAAAPRAYAFGLVSGKGKSSGVEMVGVDPVAEPRVTKLHEQLRQGRYLDTAPTPWPAGRELTEAERARDEALTDAAEDDALAEIEALGEIGSDDDEPTAEAAAKDNAEAAADTQALAKALSPPPERALRVILGQSLAKVLGAEIGSELYVSTVTIDGLVEAVFLEVVGIYRTGTQLYDRNRIYLHVADLRRLTHLAGAVHEVALLVDPVDEAPAIAAAIQTKLGKGDSLLVRSWDRVRPDLKQMLNLNEVSTDLMVFIIFIVATLGVVNTMLMSVFERTRELGVLKAIGMSGGRIVSLIVCETLFLVLAAAAVGTALGLGLDGYMVHYGVDLSSITGGFSLAGVGLNPVIYGVITPRGVLMPTAVLSTTCLLASLYPALRAARMQPAVGMRAT
jgi:ABC-type lipoprotein release transport system permease subunit